MPKVRVKRPWRKARYPSHRSNFWTQFLGIKSDDKLSPGFHKHQIARYPVIDHEYYVKTHGYAKDYQNYMVVSHAYWNEATEEQLNFLRQHAREGVEIIVRDALWYGKHTIKQIFLCGSKVHYGLCPEPPLEPEVLKIEYNAFDDRCSAPGAE